MSKNIKTPVAGEQYAVCYGADKYIVLVTGCVVILISLLAVIGLQSFFAFLFLLIPIILLVLMILYSFRFRILFQMDQKELEIRKLSGKLKKISLDEIQEIYYSTDGKVKFLNIITGSVKIHVNTAACENVQFLEVFLRMQKPDSFSETIVKESHVL